MSVMPPEEKIAENVVCCGCTGVKVEKSEGMASGKGGRV